MPLDCKSKGTDTVTNPKERTGCKSKGTDTVTNPKERTGCKSKRTRENEAGEREGTQTVAGTGAIRKGWTRDARH